MDQQDFSAGGSFVHQLDPRVKILAATAFSMVAAVLTRHSALAAAAGAAILLVILARLPARTLARRLATVNVFLLFLWLTLPLAPRAGAPLHIGPVGVNPDGFVLALVLTVKSNAIVLACIALLATHAPQDTARGLSRLRVPAKIIHILMFMLRYLSEIRREYGWMKSAMTMRGFQPGTNLRTYRSFARMVGLLLVLAYEKAEAIHAAMLCRGFQGRFYTLDEFSFDFRDAVFAAATTGAVACIALLQWMPLS